MKYAFCFAYLLVGCVASSQGLVEKNGLVYGKSLNWHNHLIDLKFDLLYPNAKKKLPLIVFVHGGGFSEQSAKEYSQPFCKRLATNGFVVANVEYRTGVSLTPDSLRINMAQAVYRASQDEKAAVRYLVYNAAEYSIDTSLVFLAGESAGGVTSLFSAYVSQSDWDQLAPPLHSVLGSLDSSGNNVYPKFKIKGVINLWGGIADTALISQAEAKTIPVLLFHSEDDAEVPFEQASHPQAKNQLLQGSRDIANRFISNNACYQLYFTRGAGHAYGFSSDYLATAISKFIAGIRKGHCNSTEVAVNEKMINLSFNDLDSVAFPDEETKIIKLSPDILKRYAGKYEGRGIVVTMSVEGDHLKGEVPGQPADEFYPLSETIFLQKKYNNRLEYKKDSNGNVTGQIMHFTKQHSFFYKKIE